MLAVLNKQTPDRIPWIPRLGHWYDAHLRAKTLPECYQGMSLRQIERALGAGTPAREGCVVMRRHDGVEVSRVQKGADLFTEYRTPV
jgi:hypothetical protein